MTMTAEHLSLRAVVVTDESPDDANQPICRLLSELGHEVAGAASPDEAVSILQDAGADLLVVDLPTAEQKQKMFDRLAALPREAKPSRVALFSDEADDFTRSLNREHDNSRVHVFIKPLHLHGLLNVLRNIDGRNLAPA